MNSFRTRLNLESLDGRVMPSGNAIGAIGGGAVAVATDMRQGESNAASDPTNQHFITATVNIDPATGTITVTGAVSPLDYPIVTVEATYIDADGIPVTVTLSDRFNGTVQIDAEGSFTWTGSYNPALIFGDPTVSGCWAPEHGDTPIVFVTAD